MRQTATVRIRIVGTPGDVAATVGRLKQFFTVLDVSPDRHQPGAVGMVARYVTIKPPGG